MNPAWLSLSALGAAVLTTSVVFARRPVIGPAERRVFHAVNGLPDWLYWPLWLPMQLGNLVVGTGAGLVIAGIVREWTVALGVLAAAALKLVAERLIRKEMAGALAVRQRPGTSQVGAHLRGGDVPRSGPSFPSGHVILVAAVACVLMPSLPTSWAAAPLLAAVAVMVGRVYVGAHNPLDVAAGLGAGLTLGGVLAMIAG